MTYQDFHTEWLNGETYIIAHTSGSTGLPKSISLNKAFVRKSALATNNFFCLDSHSVLHSCISPDFIGGKMMLIRALECGGAFSFETPTNQPLADSRLPEITLLAVVPSQMIYIVENIHVLPKIKNIIIGGSAIPTDLRKKIYESGLNAYETYGMTETASHIALRRVTPDPLLPFKVIGHASVSANANGCLTITYPDGTDIETNDLAVVLNSNEFIITGRIDDRIITGGKKIDPAELEERLKQIVKIPFFLSSVPDSKWGERMVMVVEESVIIPDGIMTQIRSQFEGYETPKEILILKEFPKTASGKISRKELKRLITEKKVSKLP